MLCKSFTSASTPYPTVPPPPDTEERAWQVLRQYLAAQTLELVVTPSIPIGTPTEILQLMDAAITAGISNARTFGNVELPSFP